MIPIIGPVLNTAFQAFNVMTLAGTAGKGDGFGRKKGRVAWGKVGQGEVTISEKKKKQREEKRGKN